MNTVIKEFKKRNNFIITSHIKPEGDSIGSQIAVLHLLKSMGKKAVIVNQDEIPDNLKFLPGTEHIKHEVPGGFKPDTAVFLDCPVKERAGNVTKCLDDTVFVINIDHHVSNEYYGDVNWVESGMSSVGEMVYHVIKELGVEVNDAVLWAVYTAIITDTGMFNYDNTTGKTHEVAGELVEQGIKPRFMHSEIFEKKSLSYLKMLGKILATVRVEENGLLAHVSLTRKMLEEEGMESVSTEEFINYPRSIKGVEVAVFFNEGVGEGEAVNVSFRSNGKIDVNRIALGFGGGGHERASGCLMHCSMKEAKKKVLKEVKKIIRK